MDALDGRILEILEVDASQTSEKIGKAVGVSSSTIRRRINRLMKEDRLKLVALPNPTMEGHRIRVLVGINVTVGSSSRVADALIDHPSCYTVSECVGRFDIMVSARFRSLEEILQFVNVDLYSIGNVRRTETIVLVSPHKYHGFILRTGEYETNSAP